MYTEDIIEKLHTIGYFLLVGIGAWLFHLTITNFILINFYSCTEVFISFKTMPESLKNVFNIFGNNPDSILPTISIIVNILVIVMFPFYFLLIYGFMYAVGFFTFSILIFLLKEALIHFHFLSETTRNETLENLVKKKRQVYLNANEDFVTSKIGFTIVLTISYLVGIYYFHDSGFMCNDLFI